MNCKDATSSYEAWLRKRASVIEEDLDLKHREMSADIFPFMRATYYRWIELWKDSCSELDNAPTVSAVGDLHAENFGTWRDREARLIWGINDFDETATLPYTNDLVRLAVSVHLSIAADELAIEPDDACEAILKGYKKGLADGGAPFVLVENHEWLRNVVMSDVRDPVKFWNKLQKLADVEPVPDKARKTLAKALPERKLDYRVVHRVAGLGSLGRERYLAIAEWNGGLVAREVKARVPAATVWLAGKKDSNKHHHDAYEKIIKQAVRCPDPSLELHKQWVLRRLAHDSSRVELKSLPKHKDERKLLEAMGRETANIHLGSSESIRVVQYDLFKRRANWLNQAALVMVQATTTDWQSWRGGKAESTK
ncbi:MAG TPA: DUF2252 family protein [Pyrinomonadaceae bacterium]|nr:DUF2252 family protein [Pyrinomonadaceae bacterium]